MKENRNIHKRTITHRNSVFKAYSIIFSRSSLIITTIIQFCEVYIRGKDDSMIRNERNQRTSKYCKGGVPTSRFLYGNMALGKGGLRET